MLLYSKILIKTLNVRAGSRKCQHFIFNAKKIESKQFQFSFQGSDSEQLVAENSKIIYVCNNLCYHFNIYFYTLLIFNNPTSENNIYVNSVYN